MIEVNLSPRAKENDIASFGGFNLSDLNLRMMALALFCFYGLEPFLLDYFESDIQTLNTEVKKVRTEQRKVSRELAALEHVKKQVEDLNKQEVALSQRVNAVKVIVDKRQNPFKVFKYIAENTPEDVWIFELELDDRNLKMTGYSKSWKSIGAFLENLKSSIFFNQNNISFEKPSGVKSEYNGKRVEAFRITAQVMRFQ